MKLRSRIPLALFSLSCAVAAPALAQDSVSRTGTGVLPGDAVSPYDVAEQVNTYVVDLTPLKSSWGTGFAIAPVAKSSKGSSSFPNNLFSAQGASNTIKRNVPFPFATYSLWNKAGYGINDDPALNLTGTTLNVGGRLSHQIAAAFSEFATTDGGASGNYVVTALINRRPKSDRRLYVSRIATAVNGVTDFDNDAQLGFGSVDSDGNTYFRADDFGLNGNNPISEDNVFRVPALARNPLVLNSIGGTGATDAGTWLVNASTTAHNTPGCVPEQLFGRPVYAGSNFATQYAYESSAGTVSYTTAHLGGSSDHRGNVAFSNRKAFPSLATVGTAALLAKDGAGLSRRLQLWGVSAADAGVAGTLSLDPPATVADGDDGYTFPDGNVIGESVHHLSQTAFRGGNGLVAVGKDPSGKILVAATLASAVYAGSDNPFNGVVVGRFDPADPAGTIQWTLAGYVDLDSATTQVNGKAIRDGRNGAAVGRMAAHYEWSFGFGPSVSAPMIDAAGNVWFTSVVALDKPGGQDVDTALVRAVLDPNTFSYQLELVLELGEVIKGQNSDRDYQVTFMGIIDSNSIDSGATWSGNMVQEGHNGMDVSGLDPADARTLGGLVFTAEITYDVNNDGMFDDQTAPDESYQVLMYLGWDGRQSHDAEVVVNELRGTTGSYVPNP